MYVDLMRMLIRETGYGAVECVLVSGAGAARWIEGKLLRVVSSTVCI